MIRQTLIKVASGSWRQQAVIRLGSVLLLGVGYQCTQIRIHQKSANFRGGPVGNHSGPESGWWQIVASQSDISVRILDESWIENQRMAGLAMPLIADWAHVSLFGVRFVAVGTVVHQVLKLARCIRQPTCVRRLQMRLVIKPNSGAVLPARLIFTGALQPRENFAGAMGTRGWRFRSAHRQ